jgi:quercetin dioxygenase-like cupin family protein
MAGEASMRYLAPGGGPVLHVLDEIVRVVVDPAETGGDLLVFAAATPEGCGPGLHAHDARETFWVLAGTVEFRTLDDGRIVSYLAGSGSSIQVPPGVPHGYTALGGEALVHTTFTPGAPMHAFFLALDALSKRFPDGLSSRAPEFQTALRSVAEQYHIRRFPDPSR